MRILRSFQYQIKVLVSQKIHVYLHEFTEGNTDICVCFHAALLFDCQEGDFLIHTGGLKRSSMIPAQNLKLILRSFEK